MPRSKLLLSISENAIFVRHLVLVVNVISQLFLVISLLLVPATPAIKWYHYLLAAGVSLLTACVTLYAIVWQRIRAIGLGVVLLFASACIKLAVIILIIHRRTEIYDQCYNVRTKADVSHCDLDDWRVDRLNLMTSLVFMVPSASVDLISSVALCYLIKWSNYGRIIIIKR